MLLPASQHAVRTVASTVHHGADTERRAVTSMLAVLAHNPIPLIALAGFVFGGSARWVFDRPDLTAWIWLVALVLGGLPLVGKTLVGLLRGTFAADVVAMLAIITAVVLGEYIAGLVIVLMQSGGEALDRSALRRASSTLQALLARAPRRTWRKQEDYLLQIDVAKVRVGDVLVVRSGDLVPVDGTPQTPQASVDESALTGEPLNASKHAGDRVVSGSVNMGDAFEMIAERVSADSQYARIVQLVRAAHEDRPPIRRLADRYAVWFTPLTLMMSALGWLITSDPRTMLAVLVVATPCPLILATPVAIISGINRAARRGIIVKGGGALEQVGRAEAVVFDKTGTLTRGHPVVERVLPLDRHQPDGLLLKAASVEQLSSHLLARMITETAQRCHPVLPLPSKVREVPGRGMAGEVAGEQIVVGSRRFVAEQLGPEHVATATQYLAHQNTHGTLSTMIGINGQLAGMIMFRDHLRPGVTELIARLRALGVQQIVMLTGDSWENARTVAAQAGIEEVRAGVLPEQKAAAIETLKQQHQTVVMVGDGINDAPALATATVGIAMGVHGTTVSAEAADVVILMDDVSKVGDAVSIGQRTARIAQQSIIVGLGLSLVLMVIASVGVIPPVIGAVFQEAIDIAVILNALRAR